MHTEIDGLSCKNSSSPMSNTSNQLLAPNTTTKFCLMFNPNGPCKHNSVLRISLQSDEKRNESVLLSGADARTLEYEIHAECKPIRDWSFVVELAILCFK